MTGAERETCTVMAAMLNAQRALAHLGLLLTVVVSGVVMGAAVLSVEFQTLASVAIGAALFIGATERYFAFRIRLDEHLFNALACGEIVSTTSMDQALVRLGLLAADSPERQLQQRLLGAHELCKKHRVLVVGQFLTVIVFVLLQVG